MLAGVGTEQGHLQCPSRRGPVGMPAIPKCLACLVTFDAAEHTPMVLGVCGHSICLACIERLKNLSQAEQTCPTCREPTDPMSSKPNFALRDSIAAATAAAVQAPPPPVPSGVDACPTHGDRIRFLCATHNLLCCATCFLEDHEDCDRHPLEAARQSLERRIITALNDMRESGEKLQNGQVALAERANLLSSKREAVKSQVHAFFHEYAMELERRRETLLTQADAYFDSLESTVRSRQTYLGNGLMFLEGLFQEMSSIRKASPVEFLLKAPSIASRMESAVVEAKLAIGPIDDLVRADGPMPSFAPPSSAAIAAGLATIKVLDGTVPPSPTPVTAALPPSSHAPLPAPPAVTTLAAIEAPSPLPASPARPVHTVSPPLQASPQAPPPANGAAVQAAKPPPGHISAMLPPPRPNGTVAPPPPRAPSPPAPVEAQQAAPPAVINRAGGGGGAAKRGSRPDFMDSADFPPLEPAKKGESPTDWLAVKAQEKKKEKEKKQQEKKAAAAAGAKAAPQPQQQNGEKEQHIAAKPAAGGGGGGKGGGKFHKEKAKAAPVEPFDASKPHVCVMNNITNGGMDGFLHLHPPDGSYFAIYYNFIGKVATINRDGSDPKSYRKGEKFLVELKDNPYVQLAEEKPERKYVASGLRRAP